MTQSTSPSLAKSPPAHGRAAQVDSLRGLAALTVVVTHCLAFFTVIQADTWLNHRDVAINVLKYSPLHVIYAGHEAVMLFFVVSGFVLTLSLDRPATYRAYLIKRICRIYLPYFAAVCSGLVLWSVVGNHHLHGLSGWYRSIWSGQLSGELLAGHLGLVGSFANGRINPVFWSLVHEMRISIIFPAMLLVTKRTPWLVALTLALAVSATGYYGYLHYPATDYFETVNFSLMFVVGMLIALHRDVLTSNFRSLAAPVRILLLASGVIAYTWWWILPKAPLIHLGPLNDWAVTTGAAILLLTALSSQRATAALGSRVPTLLGRVSYSLYLFHAIVLIGIVNAFDGRVPIAVAILLGAGASLPVAIVAHRYIEVPAMKLGRRLAPRFGNHDGAAVPGGVR